MRISWGMIHINLSIGVIWWIDVFENQCGIIILYSVNVSATSQFRWAAVTSILTTSRCFRLKINMAIQQTSSKDCYLDLYDIYVRSHLHCISLQKHIPEEACRCIKPPLLSSLSPSVGAAVWEQPRLAGQLGCSLNKWLQCQCVTRDRLCLRYTAINMWCICLSLTESVRSWLISRDMRRSLHFLPASTAEIQAKSGANTIVVSAMFLFVQHGLFK